MMKKIIFLSALFISFTGISQEQKSHTIDSQFSDLIENSNTYQTYKVIKISELGVLQRNIRDSISTLKATITESESVILEQNNKIDSITHQIEGLNVELEQTQKKVENINFLGISTQKSTYNFIMWSIIIALLFVSSILFFSFKKRHNDTKDAREKLAETESELDSLRKRSLEREQKVRRELQDEINKNKARRE
ncbi:MAG TPA: hypothetical protein VKX30_05205 [Flavobacteriaceae bacterium]|nr:hypothetical protein [Flavobacteriaceae bacterium]